MRRLLVLLAVLVLAAPLMFYGCSGDDGSTGATGATGATGSTGDTGPPGASVLAKETCVACHGQGRSFDVAVMHQISSTGTLLTSGTVDAAPTAMTFSPTGDGDNVTVTVTFKFTAKNSAGQTVTSAIDLRTGGVDGAAPQYLRFSLARLVPGFATQGGGQTPNEWNAYIVNPSAGGSSKYYRADGSIVGNPVSGVYTYTFPAGTVTGYVPGVNDNQVHRVAIQVRNPPIGAFFVNGLDPGLEAPVGNNTFDWVPGLAATPTAEYPTRNIVVTANCNQCHDPLAIHGGGRRITQFCVNCHNPTIETAAGGAHDNGTLAKMVHGIHDMQYIGDLGDFTEITYPQSPKNCTTCHKGGSDSDNWKNVPSRDGCSGCHPTIFAAGGSHEIRTDASCDFCHSPTGEGLFPPSTTAAHADNTATPGNVPAGLDNIAYFIDNVTVDNTFPVVTFRVTKNGTPIVFNPYTGGDNNALKVAYVSSGLITGYTGSPSLLVAFATMQDDINPMADYNNLGSGKAEGQPASVSVAELFTGDGGSITGPDAAGAYKGTLKQQVSRNSTTGNITSTYPANYPAGAQLRAVGLQGRLRQIVGGVQVARPAVSKVAALPGDAVRRVVVDKAKCLGCHEQLALHGSNRVNEVQLCVMCHNPNLGAGEFSWNFKDMIHAIHAASSTYVAGNFNAAEVTYPAQLNDCGKCHAGSTFKADLPAGVLLSTNSAIGAAPTMEDIVVSPTAAACGRCHNPNTKLAAPTDQGGFNLDESGAADHFKLMGGDVNATREEADLTGPPTTLGPVVVIAP